MTRANADLEAWIRRKGFRYWCYISWPHGGHELRVFVGRLHKKLCEEFGYSFGLADVFIDYDNVEIGADWLAKLSECLSRSVAMVAVLTPQYFRREYTRREWAGKEALSSVRLPLGSSPAVFPVVFRATNPLPQAARRLQYSDLSHIAVQRSDVHNTQNFRLMAQEIVQATTDVAHAMTRHNHVNDHTQFRLPESSALGVAPPPMPKLPTRKK